MLFSILPSILFLIPSQTPSDWKSGCPPPLNYSDSCEQLIDSTSHAPAISLHVSATVIEIETVSHIKVRFESGVIRSFEIAGIKLCDPGNQPCDGQNPDVEKSAIHMVRNLCLNRKVSIHRCSCEDVGLVYVGDVNVAHELLLAGLVQCQSEKCIQGYENCLNAAAERFARKQHRGIWKSTPD